jgi:hypothetical protein
VGVAHDEAFSVDNVSVDGVVDEAAGRAIAFVVADGVRRGEEIATGGGLSWRRFGVYCERWM